MPIVTSRFDTKVVLEQKIEYLEMKAQEVASDGNSGAIRHRQMEYCSMRYIVLEQTYFKLN